MVRHLVVFSLGPVQSFISQARRTHDLWLGSRLLSHLAQHGVETAVQSGAKMLYPVKKDGHWPDSIPNRFMFFTDDAKSTVENTELAIRQAWQELAYDVKQYFMGQSGTDTWENTWQRQVDAWLELYWVTAPVDDEEDYWVQINRANRAMAARKLMRHFPVVSEPGQKCSLCGEREVLHDGDTTLSGIRTFWKDVRVRFPNPAMLREGERLCAVCTIKRFVPEVNSTLKAQARFPSTSSIASVTWRLAVLQHWQDVIELRDAVASYRQALKTLKVGTFAELDPLPVLESIYYDQLGGDDVAKWFLSIDGDYFYEETLTEKRLEEYTNVKPRLSELQRAQQALRHLLAAAAACDIAPPHPYYAVLAMDGDHIGKAIGRCDSSKQHKDFSNALASFATDTAKPLVEETFNGRLVYSGGDDVLALIPLHTILDAANTLRIEFRNQMNKDEPNEEEKEPKLEIHMSAGIAVVHHTQPLEMAIHAAREAEHTAKENEKYNRNSIVVQLMRRSGETETMGMRWDIDGEETAEKRSHLETVIGLQSAFEQNLLARQLPYDLDRLAYAMEALPKKYANAREVELKRFLRRRMTPDDNLAARVEAFSEPISSLGEDVSWGDAARWTRLARFLAQGGDV